MKAEMIKNADSAVQQILQDCTDFISGYSQSEMLAIFYQWYQNGWVTALDCHFVKFCALNEGKAIQFATLLVSHQYGEGHICVDLAKLLLKPTSAAPNLFINLLQQLNDLAAFFHQWQINSIDDWLAQLANSPIVAEIDVHTHLPQQALPLVLDQTSLYLYRLWYCEYEVAQAISRLVLQPVTDLTDRIQKQLDELFGIAKTNEVNWQKIACALALQQDFVIISGGPGTGKTTTVVKLLWLLQQQAQQQYHRPLNIALSAPTGKAAARLAAAINHNLVNLPSVIDIPRQAQTLHRLLAADPESSNFYFNQQQPLPFDVIVVDEASMIDLELLHALLMASAKAKIILLGDPYQLASVEAGAILGELCFASEPFSLNWQQRLQIPTAVQSLTITNDGTVGVLANQVVRLKESYRFTDQSGIQALAKAINQADYNQLLQCWFNYDDIAWISHKQLPELDQLMVEFYQPYWQAIKNHADAATILATFEQFRVLCAIRTGPWSVNYFNQYITQLFRNAGFIQTTQNWYVGRAVMITRNDHGLGLANGDIGIALPHPTDLASIQVFFATAGGIKSFSTARLTHIETVFAMTVHKSQGSEFSKVLLVLPATYSALVTRELLYTALTRARERFVLCCEKLDDFIIATQRKISRDSHLQRQLKRFLMN